MKKNSTLFLVLLFFGRISCASISVAVTPTASATTLDLSTSQNALNIASIVVSWTLALDTNAISVLLHSLNGGQLRHATATGAGTFINYSVSYSTTGPTQLTTSDQTFGSVTRGVTASSNTANLSITYTGIPFSQLRAGTYSDTIVVDLSEQ